MDMSKSIEPNSQQVNAEDLISAPRTVTITGVEAGTSEQPVFVHMAEFPGRTYRPSKTARRLLVAMWGSESAAYVGRKMTIYREPNIRFGKDLVGGILISHASHIDKPVRIALAVSRGKRSDFTVEPLADAPTVDPNRDKADKARAAIEAATDVTKLDEIEAYAVKLGLDVADAIARKRGELGAPNHTDGGQ